MLLLLPMMKLGGDQPQHGTMGLAKKKFQARLCRVLGTKATYGQVLQHNSCRRAALTCVDLQLSSFP